MTAKQTPQPRPDAHESAWYAAMDELDPDLEVLPGLTVADVRAFHRRPRTPNGARFRLRVPYGRAGAGGRPLTLSLYARSSRRERRPVVVFVHGGGWAGGDPYLHIRHAHALAAGGYVTATISYRLYPEARWPDSLEDAKAAVRWIRANAARIGADPDRIAVAGGSAGGHLSAMVALTPGQFEGAGGNPTASSAVQAAVLWYPATDVTRMTYEPEQAESKAMIEGFFGEPLAETQRQASPIWYVHRGAPPILTITGADDILTPLSAIRDFHAELDRHGATNRLEVFEGRGHGFELYDAAEWQLSFEHVVSFLAEHLGEPPRPAGGRQRAAASVPMA